MERMKRRVGTVAAVLALALGGACTPVKQGTTTEGPAYAPPRGDAATAAPEPEKKDDGAVLPFLNALFYNGKFVEELKTKARLTSNEIEKVRAVVQQESENQADMSAQAEAESDQRARQRIREAIGPEKADRVFALAREHWGGEAIAVGEGPNAVPKDTRVVVNTPAYRLDVWHNGQLVKSYKVGIGYPEFPLAQGLRRADTIIFNPEWVPPDEPWIVKDKVEAGERVKPGDPRNPLGPVKIPLGGGTLIHGGKAVSRLASFASHGCVGMTTPQVKDFVKLLAQVSGSRLTPAQVDAHFNAKTQTKHVALEKPVPIELRYETIVVENGRLNIYRDVYGKGTNTEENLRAVLAANGVKLEDLPEADRAAILAGLEAMAVDAFGRPALPGGPGTENETSKIDTKTMKGEKVKSFELAALAGKGYPGVVALDNGTGKPAAPDETTIGAPRQQNQQAAKPAPAKKKAARGGGR